MSTENHLRSQRWQLLISRIEREYQQLSEAERNWIAGRLRQIETLQQQLHQLFIRGQGERVCADCLGGCCARGHNHMTLANLLGYLKIGKRPPPPDFSRTCPFLSDTGCQLPVIHRPYNCISFVCDIIEENLIQEELADFYSIERQLRGLYQQFAERHAGASLTGLLIQEQRLGNRDFFSRKQRPT